MGPTKATTIGGASGSEMKALTKFNTFIWATKANAGRDWDEVSNWNGDFHHELGTSKEARNTGAGAADAAISVQSNNYVSRCYPNLRAPEQET